MSPCGFIAITTDVPGLVSFNKLMPCEQPTTSLGCLDNFFKLLKTYIKNYSGELIAS